MYNMNDLYKNYYDNYRQYDDVCGYINYYNMDYNRMNPYYIKDYGAEPFVININEITKQNKKFSYSIMDRTTFTNYINEYKCRRKYWIRNAFKFRPVY